MLETVLTAVVVLFPVSELVLLWFKRSSARSAHSDDRGSMRVLWLCITVGIFLAVFAREVDATRMSFGFAVRGPIALGLLVAGLAVRWAAIITLGRFFTVDVAVHSQHAVVRTGLYQYVRHPSYSGMILAFAGLGVYYGNWLSLVAMFGPIAFGLVKRVRQEERVLAESLGQPYLDYCATTPRFVPRLR